MHAQEAGSSSTEPYGAGGMYAAGLSKAKKGPLDVEETEVRSVVVPLQPLS